MIKITVDNIDTRPENVWYHYRERGEVLYQIKISVEEVQLRSIIESYAQCPLTDSRLSDLVMENDKIRRSIGLMWQILNYTNKNDNSDIDIHWELVVNCITSFKVSNGFIVMDGFATKFS